MNTTDKLKQISQIGQEDWVLNIFNKMKNGVFVEIGASNGIYFSNTLTLERTYNWDGLCIEPSSQYTSLVENRNCSTEKEVIYDHADVKIDFIEDEKNDSSMSFSGIKPDLDKHQPEGLSYKRTTTTLTDLLDKLNFTTEIDYLSIDTEGSEYKIICGIDFNKYHFSLITVEHNWVEPKRSKIRKHLFDRGYHLDILADSRFDDWYIHESLINNISTINRISASAKYSSEQTLINSLQKQLKEKESFIQNQSSQIIKLNSPFISIQNVKAIAKRVVLHISKLLRKLTI